MASHGTDLFGDTLYRRMRRVILHSLHAADDVLSHIGRSHVRVLFEATSPVSLAVFRPVFEQLRRDPRIDFWFLTSDRSWDADRIFRAADITEHIVAAADVQWMKFDAYINTDFWNTTWLPRRARRIHMFHGVAGKYGLDAPVRIAPVVASFDRLLFPNRDRFERYVRAGLIDPGGAQGVLVGYPKADCLVDGSLEQVTVQRSLGLDPSLPTVLYAPTWSPYSSLGMMGEEIIAALSRLNINVIVKLHDRSFDGTARGSGGVDWRSRLDRLCRDRGVHVAQETDVSPYMVAADVLVTDHSSVGFEFMLLDRPLVVVDCPTLIEKARVNRDKVRLLRSAADVVGDADGVASTAIRALANPSRFGSERRTIAADLFYGAGSATARALTCIYDLLDLPAHYVEPRTAKAAPVT